MHGPRRPFFVRTIGEHVYILHRSPSAAWLIEARREENRLLGQWMNIGNLAESRPWVGLIVDGERIDGQWPAGRLDLRRRLAEVLPVPPRVEESKP